MSRSSPLPGLAPNARAAALFMLLSSALIAGTTLLAKALGTDALGPPLHPLQISQARFVFALLAIGSVAVLLRPAFARPNWGLHVARTSCGWLGVTLMFAASAQIPLADATAISFLSPVFTLMLAIPLLGERVGPIRWSAAAIALAGGLILTRPGTGSLAFGAVLALGAAVVMGLEVIFIKRLAGRERPLQLLLTNNALGVGISSAAALWVFVWPSPAQWPALIALGVMMAGAQFCFISAMARADASFAMPFFYATLVFAALYDALLFGVLPDAVTYAGAAIVLCGAGLLAWREARRAA